MSKKIDPKVRDAAKAEMMKLGLNAEEADAVVRSRIASPYQPQASGLTVKAQDGGKSADILIYGDIGMDFWTGGGITAKSINEEIGKLGAVDTLNVFINSLGGDVFEGLAIYSLFNRQEANVVVQVDGIAASAASVIAMAGDEILMAEASMMMIHDAWGIMAGNSQDALDFAEVLDKIDGQIATAYTTRTGKKSDKIRGMMDDETWMSATEAVDMKFADKVVKGKKAAAMAFDLSRFKNAPKALPEPKIPDAAAIDGEPLKDDPKAAENAKRDAEAVKVRARLVELEATA